MSSDTVFAGTPDDVVAQIRAFNERVGGIGHLLCFAQGGHISHEDTCENIRLIATEVLPQLQDLNPGRPASARRPVAGARALAAE